MAPAAPARVAYVDVTCPVCRLPRSITGRQASRIGKGATDGRCRSCRNPRAQRPPDDADRAFWLRKFNDDEIVELCLAFFGSADAASVARWREKLAITANGKAARL